MWVAFGPPSAWSSTRKLYSLGSASRQPRRTSRRSAEAQSLLAEVTAPAPFVTLCQPQPLPIVSVFAGVAILLQEREVVRLDSAGVMLSSGGASVLRSPLKRPLHGEGTHLL